MSNFSSARIRGSVPMATIKKKEAPGATRLASRYRSFLPSWDAGRIVAKRCSNSRLDSPPWHGKRGRCSWPMPVYLVLSVHHWYNPKPPLMAEKPLINNFCMLTRWQKASSRRGEFWKPWLMASWRSGAKNLKMFLACGVHHLVRSQMRLLAANKHPRRLSKAGQVRKDL